MAASAASPTRASERAPNTASVFATVGHSEWCPPGTVQLDLMTRRYTVTAPRTWRNCRRPAFSCRVRTGVLTETEIMPIRVTYDMGILGLEHPVCQIGRRPEQIIISNGGTPILRLTDRGRTTSAPNDQTCWSGAASRLRCLLDDLFSPSGRLSVTRRSRPESPSYTSPDAVQNCSRRWPLMGAPARPGG